MVERVRAPAARCANALNVLLSLVIAFCAACEVTDISRVYDLRLDPTTAEDEVALQLPGVSRIGVDMALDNVGNNAGEFTIQSQVQTSGNTEDAACQIFAGASVRTVQSVASSTDLTEWSAANASLVRELGDGVRILRPVGADAGLVEIRLRTSSFYRFVASSPITGLRVATVDGVEILPSSYIDDTFACEQASVNALYTLSEGVYFLELTYGAEQSDDDPLLLLDRECSELRRVSRTCPGASSDVAFRRVTLGAGERFETRFSAADLGVGDIVVVNLSGMPGDEATLEFTVSTTELDCRISSDCTGRRTCSEHGYCEVPVSSSGCSASTGGSRQPPGATLLLLLLIAGALLMSRRHRPAVALMIAVLLSLAAPAVAEERRVEVFFAAGGQSRAFSSDVGQFSSPGFGANVSQGVWFGRIGFHLTLSADAFLTTQPAPPLNRGTQAFTAAAGPRFGGHIRDFRLWGGVDLMNTTMITNTLVRYTGDRRSFTAPALTAGVRWDGLAPLFVEFVPSLAWYRSMNSQPTMRSFHVNFGVLGGR